MGNFCVCTLFNTASSAALRIEPGRTYARLALIVEHCNHFAKDHPHSTTMLKPKSHPLLG